MIKNGPSSFTGAKCRHQHDITKLNSKMAFCRVVIIYLLLEKKIVIVIEAESSFSPKETKLHHTSNSLR